jgi:3-mercaptopyruvate sulfurtransferase SseA
MLKGSTCRRLLAAASLLVVPLVASAQPAGSHLVDVRWVEKNLGSPDVLILDASPTQLYRAQHIPGAVSVDFMVYGGRNEPLADIEARYRSWGVSPEKTVVLYDQGGTFLATRVFFALYYHGFPEKNLRILDGGMAKWQAASLPVSKEATPAPVAGSFRIEAPNESVRVRLPEFLAASADPQRNVLLEALGPDWHFGEVVPFGRPGHPPNGVMLPAADFYNADKTFKSPEELRRIVDYLGIAPEQQVLSYCGGGVAASVPFFALKFMLGYPDVKLFIESEMGYLADERQLPMWTYDAPYLARDAGWLQAWGGRMLRMYTGAPVSIVDVRPAEAFSGGHVPFALNVPADLFAANAGTPEKLASALGAAGVNVDHEAVVVSGAGLTKDAALAFVMLEKLGQRKVSVLMDSMERWAGLGLPLTKDPTVIGPRKAPGDLAIPPTNYPSAVKAGVMVTGAGSTGTRGLYPKVFVASGSTLPSGPLDGTVAHVPHTALLNADGTPKPAKDIWRALTAAGVPRYGELVCVSDDPAEAAVNYFVLKLMGYPDVKVLVR